MKQVRLGGGVWGGWRYARRGRMVAGTGGACGERWEKRGDEMREPGAWAWAGPQMAWSVEKALESQPQGWGHACRGGGVGLCFAGGLPLAFGAPSGPGGRYRGRVPGLWQRRGAGLSESQDQVGWDWLWANIPQSCKLIHSHSLIHSFIQNVLST